MLFLYFSSKLFVDFLQGPVTGGSNKVSTWLTIEFIFKRLFPIYFPYWHFRLPFYIFQVLNPCSPIGAVRGFQKGEGRDFECCVQRGDRVQGKEGEGLPPPSDGLCSPGGDFIRAPQVLPSSNYNFGWFDMSCDFYELWLDFQNSLDFFSCIKVSI